MFTHFKNDSIRKLVVGFGNLFNGIIIEQINADNSKRMFNVPLSYATKEKFIKRLTDNSSITDTTRIEIGVPQMAFELQGMVYDSARKLNKLSKKINISSNLNTAGVLYSEVPYNFTFNVYVYTRNIEDNLQILEQILPHFSPEFIISLNMNELNTSVDIPIVLVETNLSQNSEGSFDDRRNIITTYQFLAKSYIYSGIKTDQTIRDIQVTTKNLPFTFTDTFGLTG